MRDRTEAGDANVFPHPATRRHGDARQSSYGRVRPGEDSAGTKGCSLVAGKRDLEELCAMTGEGDDEKPD